jgi:hypothetical protein
MTLNFYAFPPTGFLSAIAILLIFHLTACMPSDVPVMSPDGKYVLCLETEKLAEGADAKTTPDKSLILITMSDLSAKKIELDKKWSLDCAAWIENRIILNAAEPRPPSSISVDGPTHKLAVLMLDPSTKSLSVTAMPASMGTLPFVGKYKDESTLLAIDDQKKMIRVFSLDGKVELGSLPFEADSAGHGWMIRVETKAEREPMTTDLIAIHVYGPNCEETCTITAEEIAKACTRQARSPELAVVSSDGAKLLLAFSTETIFRQAETDYTFGMFDLASGKLLYSDGSNALHGVPLVDSDSVTAIEAEDRNRRTVEFTSFPVDQPSGKIVLARHTAAGREVLSSVPIDGVGDQAQLYSFTPDGSSCIIQVEGPKPRLLIMPVAKDVTLDKCREIPLP